MKISNKGIALIKEFEGCRLEAYKDPAGVPTIGYGHTSGVQMGQKITLEQAEEYLREDIEGFENHVMRYNGTYRWNQNQFDALVSFTYNIGNIDQLTAGGKRSIAEISAKIPEYCHAGGKELAGLVRRRAAEKELFDTPIGQEVAERELDPEAVRSFQEACNLDGVTDADGNPLAVDEIPGQHTGEAMKKILLKSGAFNEKTGQFSVGSEGNLVKWLQMRLNTVIGPQLVELLEDPEGLEPDGKMGNDTRLAAGLFQEIRGLKVDYLVGPDTIMELFYRT